MPGGLVAHAKQQGIEAPAASHGGLERIQVVHGDGGRLFRDDMTALPRCRGSDSGVDIVPPADDHHVGLRIRQQGLPGWVRRTIWQIVVGCGILALKGRGIADGSYLGEPLQVSQDIAEMPRCSDER